jgi:two-component system, NtrC family, sensor kinase
MNMRETATKRSQRFRETWEKRTFPFVSKSNSLGVKRKSAEASAMSLTRKTPTAARKDDKLGRQKLVQALADREAELAEAHRQNSRLLDEMLAKTSDLEEALAQQAATANVLSVISRSAFDLDALLKTLTDSARSLSGARAAAVYLRNGEVFRLRAESGVPPEFLEYARANPSRAGKDTLIGRVAMIGEAVHIPDVAADPDYSYGHGPQIGGYRAMFGAPLIRDGKVDGVFGLVHPKPGAFTPRQMEMVRAFADQAVIAIENVRLFDEVQEALERQTATADILKVIAASPADVHPVFQAIATSANKLIGGFTTAVFRIFGDAAHLAAFTSTNPGGDEALKALFPLPLARFPGIDRVLAGESAEITDTELDPEVRVLARVRGFRSMLVTPLTSNGAPIGAISVTREGAGTFSSHQVQLLKTFADQAVIAIENVRLFDEVQTRTRDLTESLEQQTGSAEILRVISSSPTDVQPVLDAIAHSAATLCEATNGAVFRLRDGLIHLVGHYSMSQKQLASLQQSFPAPLDRAIASGRAILDRAVIHIADIAAEPGYPAALATTGLRSVLSVPMLRNGESIGSINVSREAVRPFSGRQIELLKTFADQAVVAINNVGLFNETQEALRRQTATSDILKVIASSPNNLQPVLDKIVETACRLCGAYDSVVLLREGDQLRPAAHDGPIPLTFASQEISRGLLAGRAVIERRAIHIDDIAKHSDEYPVAVALASQGSAAGSGEMLWRANLVMPLMREGEAVGAIGLRRAEPVAFSEGQIELLKTFADQAVIAIENVRLLDQVHARTRDLSEALQQQTATADVLKVISRSAFDLQAVFDTLIGSAVELSGSHSGAICVRDGEVFRYRSSSGPGASSELHNYLLEHPAKPGRGSIVGRAVLSRQIEQIPDIRDDLEYSVPTNTHGNPARALLGVPLLGKDGVEGAIVLTRLQPGAFPKRQIEILQTFADQAVIAIENARLFDEVQAKTRDLEESLQQQTATADVLKAISRSAFDLDTVLETLIATALRLCDATYGQIFRRHGDVYRYAASRMDVDPAYLHHERSAEIKPGRGTLIGRVALENRAVEIVDAWNDPEYAEKEEARVGNVRAMLGVPLMRNGEMIGAFALGRAEPAPFSQRQVDLVATFADQAVIAIENVRLFDEVQARTRDVEESLTQQTATADVLKAISRTAFDLDTVLETLISTAVRLCDSNGGEIFRRYGDVYRYAASLMDVGSAYLKHEQKVEIKAGRGTLIGRVAVENRTVEIADAWNDPEYSEKEEVRVAGIRAMLGVPLMRDGELIGAFALGRTTPVPFTQRQVELVTTFADQAVIAIENARLFDEVQAKTRDLEESLQQQTATADVLKVISRSAFDLQAVLTTLAESARELCGASFVTLFMRDGEEMRLRAESGCTPEIVAFLRTHPIKAGRETFTGRVMLSREPVHLPDVLADPEYDFGDAPRIGNYRTLLGVPLLRDGQVEGVFALARPEPKPFTVRQIEMVRAFADQAVIAIENARLFDEVQARTRELAASLDDLRKAQDRLIQSEKLASLGQLTAGIAHEIKNPLNFINNYSALSRELIDELADVIKVGADDKATHSEADELIGAIGGNLDKIVQHGKRADSIVKNMLLHSREGSGERSTTNVNAMVEEALNLAYHGARAERPGFNVTIVKSLDPNAGAAEVYAQEMTRVLLNLISNGLYATNKRKQSTANGAYEPTITASTRDLGSKVEIAIRDNGTGVADEVRAKMFNPFFTTKPAGEGTGLGLSLSYDIVVKQHGGTIEVLTEPDAFTQFTIVLPRGATRA